MAERNCWHRFIALRNTIYASSSSSSAISPDIESRYRELDEELKKPFEAAAQEEDTIDRGTEEGFGKALKVDPTFKKNRKKVQIDRKMTEEERRKKSAEMVQKAGRAEDHGRLEEALKLYRLAGKLNPSEKMIKSEVDRLEKETN